MKIALKPEIAGPKILFLMLLFCASLLGVNGAARAADTPVVGDIVVSFKLDPRLTASLYMGDRWVPGNPSYTSTLQTGGQATVDVRAMGKDTRGRPMKIEPQWIAVDPDMLEIAPARKGAVTLIFKRPGESRLQVVAQGFTRELHLNAMDMGNGMQVVISKI
jgi:hypothetical protein